MSEKTYASHRRHRPNGAAAVAAPPPFDAPSLLREQHALLENATAREIHASLFLRLRLSAQQRRTAQRNQLLSSAAQQQQQQRPAASPGSLGDTTNPSPLNFYASTPEERRDVRSLTSSPPLSLPQTPPHDQPQPHHPPHHQPPRDPSLSPPAPVASNPLDDVPAGVVARRSTRESAWPPPPLSARAPSSDSAASHREAEAAADDGAGPDGEEPLRPCPHCGRRFFAASRWPRHVAVCERQQAPRMSMKSVGERSFDSSGISRKTSVADHALASSRHSREGVAKESKWRRQRAQLREALQLNKDERSSPGDSTTNGYQEEAFEDDRVLCPTCGRRFAQTAAERHIPFCKERHGGPKGMRI